MDCSNKSGIVQKNILVEFLIPDFRGDEVLLKKVIDLISEKGYSIGNIDTTLCLEKPKINPHIAKMKKVLSPILKISEDDISIKATTNEKLGYVGREEGVCAYAVALLFS